MKQENMLSIKEALEELPLSKATLIRLIWKGKVKAVKLGRKWFISREELERLKKEGTR